MAPAFIEREVVVNPGKTATVEVRVRPLGGIAGSVENVSSETLLKGVRIQLQDRTGSVLQDTTTGDDGSFRFRGVAAGTYVVKMTLPKGYLVQGETEQIVEVGGTGEVRADFQVYRHGSVQGRVTTEDGTPLADAEVALVDSAGVVIRTVRTDADGNYTFSDVPVDKYKVRVALPEAFEA
jgi:uncharacterized surface anchored protein